MKALLTDQQDVKTVQKIVENLQSLQENLVAAPENIQKSRQDWLELIHSRKWEKRAITVQRYYDRSIKRKMLELDEQGNPELSENNPRAVYHYESPPKKAQLYNKGLGDQHEIAY